MADAEDAAEFPAVAVDTGFAGVCAVSSRDLQVGELVLRCAPVAVALNDGEMGGRCSFCFCAVGPSAWSCAACGRCRLCSVCAGRASSVAAHEAECGSYQALGREGAWGDTRFLRVLLRVLHLQRQEAEGGGALPDAPVGGPALLDLASQLDALVGHFDIDDEHVEEGQILLPLDDRVSDDLFRAAQLCKLVVAPQLRRSTVYYYQSLCRILCNIFAVADSTGREQPAAARAAAAPSIGGERAGMYSDFGVALYVSGAIFNHACAPNCQWRCDGSVSHAVGDETGVPPLLEMRTSRAVEAGEELSFSYVHALCTRSERLSLLRDSFFFRCACATCREAPPDAEAARDLLLRATRAAGRKRGRGDGAAAAERACRELERADGTASPEALLRMEARAARVLGDTHAALLGLRIRLLVAGVGGAERERVAAATAAALEAIDTCGSPVDGALEGLRARLPT